MAHVWVVTGLRKFWDMLDLHDRLSAFMVGILRNAQEAHLPINDIHVLTATSPHRPWVP
ncbi:hypothetical protein PSCICL_32290 [Pseudomonas cichorii]|nr:hypothetical protein PSCICL_32290 [Pseudomonas cichorii]